jgi:chromosome segregation and condensation protein ScpB/DNA-binding XRE family transcriptional regulator
VAGRYNRRLYWRLGMPGPRRRNLPTPVSGLGRDSDERLAPNTVDPAAGDFGRRLRLRRLQLDLTQEAVALEIGVSQPFYANVELGKKHASGKTLQRLLLTLGMVEELAPLDIPPAGDDLVAHLGACLAGGSETPIAVLARGLKVSIGAVRTGLRELEQALRPKGIQVLDDGVTASLVPAAEQREACAFLLKRRAVRRRLTTRQYEALAIVMAHGEATRKMVEDQRGVDSAYVLEHLVQRGLLASDVDETAPGRPLYYRPTAAFLDLAGASTLEELRAILFAGYGSATSMEEVALFIDRRDRGQPLAPAEAQAMAEELLGAAGEVAAPE